MVRIFFLLLLASGLTLRAQQAFTYAITNAAQLVRINPNGVNPNLALLADGTGLFVYSGSSAIATNTSNCFKPNNFNGRWLGLGIATSTHGSSGGASMSFTATIADLVALNPASTTNTIVLGWNLPGDDGGGVFYYDSTSSASTNLGTVFKPVSTTGRWIRQVSGSEYPITWFGADNTAIADCRNIIQATANYARGSNGVVVIPKGSFRIVQTPLAITLDCPLIGRGGTLYRSLPTGYINPNTAETFTSTNVLTSNGTLTNATFTSATYPWNGKGELFQTLTAGTVLNVNINDGWGSPSVPGSVIPIYGIADGDEHTYYTVFHTSNSTRFEGMNIQYICGQSFQGGNNISVTGSLFGEFGDHIFYFGQFSGTQTNYTFTGNQVLTGRAASGTPGQTNYVGASSRSILKFRGNQHLTVTGNVFNNYAATPATIGIELAVDDSQPGYCEEFAIVGNTFSGDRFMDLYSTRSTNSIPSIPAGYKIRSGTVANNVLKNCTYGFLVRAATEGVVIENNFGTNLTQVADLFGDLAYTNALNLTFSRNTFYQTAAGTAQAFGIGGSWGRLVLRNNTLFNLNLTTQRSFLSMRTGQAPTGFPAANTVEIVRDLVNENNTLYDYSTRRTDDGYLAYAGGTSYPYDLSTYDDGARQSFCVVSSGGLLYYNTATTIGVAPPSAPWSLYTRQASVTETLLQNRQIGSISAASPQTAYYLVYGSPDTSRKNNYLTTSGFNVNQSTIGDPVTYNTGNGTTFATNLMEINGIAIAFPMAQGASGSVWTNNGSGYQSPATPITLSTNQGNIVTDSNGRMTSVSRTASRAMVTDSGGNPDTATTTAPEIGYVSGVTSAIQTQLNGKQGTITLTASRGMVTDGSGAPAAATTTATEIGYVNGVTSDIQTQLNTKTVDVFLGSGLISAPADATTYYIGGDIQGATAANYTYANDRVRVPFSGTIVACYGLIRTTAGIGTETSSFYINVNDTTDATVATGITMDAVVKEIYNASMSQAVSAGDYITLKWVTPTWAGTNPVNTRFAVHVYIRP